MRPADLSANPDTTLHIEGMTCGACVARVDKALRSVPGVTAAAVNLTTGIASISGPVDSAALVSAVDHAGYTARPLANASAATLNDVSLRSEAAADAQRTRLIVGLLFGIPAVAIDMFIHHQEFLAVHLFADLHSGYNILAATLSTFVLLYTGEPFFSGAWRALRHRAANMDLLVAIGAGTAWLASSISLFLWLRAPNEHSVGGMHSQPVVMEYHAAVTIIVLVTLGKWLESRAKRRAASAVAGLASHTTPTATRIAPDGALETIPSDQIQIGDTLQILAHQQFPVDGTVIEGQGSADLAVITGESLPVEVASGATLPGGATLADGRILLRATSTAGASTVARILQLVNAAQASKTQIPGLADKVAAIFVPIVLVLSALNFLAWILFTHNWQSALLTTIATIVIACPCAMGLATPTALTVALGTAAKRGILFIKASALESAQTITTVLFDKTGTLTTGKPQLTRILPTTPALSESDLLALAAAIEQFSEHPLAQAITAAAQSRNLSLPDPLSFNSIPGGGVKGSFPQGEFLAASPAYITAQNLPITDADRATLDGLQATGSTLVLLYNLTSRTLAGILALQDTLRPDTRQTLEQLKSQGLHIGVLTGDNERAAEATLKDLPLDFIRANVRPEEKAAAITQIKNQKSKIKNERVAFIGDGINDAPALAAADLGIAMSTGTDLAKSAGDVLLTSPRLAAIPQTLDLSRRTLRIIRQNLFWAFFYNVVAIPLAMLGVLSPGLSAAAMILSSLTVVLNALRLRR